VIKSLFGLTFPLYVLDLNPKRSFEALKTRFKALEMIFTALETDFKD
jgi:hypothetical protein